MPKLMGGVTGGCGVRNVLPLLEPAGSVVQRNTTMYLKNIGYYLPKNYYEYLYWFIQVIFVYFLYFSFDSIMYMGALLLLA